MESNNSFNVSDLLIKLAHLEDQVATLSSQLESNKITVSQLKQSLADRDLQIMELESKLAMAQSSLQITALARIYQCREQIRNGIDLKVVNPVLTQIQKYIDSIESLIAEAKDFIERKKAQLNHGLNATTSLVRQGPDQARAYLEKNVIEPVNALVQTAVRSSEAYYQTACEWIDQELLVRGKVLSAQIAILAKELPLDSKIMLQTRVIDPILIQVGQLSNLTKGLNEKLISYLSQSPKKLNRVVQECLYYIMELIKNSSFWDGKHRAQAAT